MGEQDGSEGSGSSLGFFSPIGTEDEDCQENVQLLGVSCGRMFSSVVKCGEDFFREENVDGEEFEGEEMNGGVEEEVVLGMAHRSNPDYEDQLADLFSEPGEEAEEDDEDILSSMM